MTALIVIGAVIAALLFAGFLHERIGRYRDSRRYPPPGRMVDIGGRSLHLVARGDGPPTVVLEAGMPGGTSRDWYLVVEEVAEFARAIAYDRAGLGHSDPGPSPRTFEAAVDDLHAALERAGERGPYVLVGHSGGGLLVREYQRRHPAEVSGLVLVDAFHEEQRERLRGDAASFRRLRRSYWIARAMATFGLLRVVRKLLGVRMLPGAVRDAPGESQRAWLATASSPSTHRHALREHRAFGSSLAAFREGAPSLGDLPVAVLTAGVGHLDEWEELQGELADLSSNSRWTVAEDSGHYVPEDAPDLVAEAIAWVIEQSETASNE
jgi:pimeloyl-ACP methyl ester carboxylesterase